MWRLQDGEAPEGLRPGVIVLHIGGSDLTYASFQVWLSSPSGLALAAPGNTLQEPVLQRAVRHGGGWYTRSRAGNCPLYSCLWSGTLTRP